MFTSWLAARPGSSVHLSCFISLIPLIYIKTKRLLNITFAGPTPSLVNKKHQWFITVTRKNIEKGKRLQLSITLRLKPTYHIKHCNAKLTNSRVGCNAYILETFIDAERKQRFLCCYIFLSVRKNHKKMNLS